MPELRSGQVYGRFCRSVTESTRKLASSSSTRWIDWRATSLTTSPSAGYVMTPARASYRVPAPDVAPLIRTAFQRAASGFSARHALRLELASLGLTSGDGRPLAISAVDGL